MGGKTKQSQRTKNNVRPSSSGRSALLLSNVNLEKGVKNLSGIEMPAQFPTLVAPNINPLVSPEVQLCIKKLNKKDPITKTKALQELSELVSNSEVDEIVAALPSWAHFYKILTADPDRKVRETTQSCHGTIVSVCGRRIAPHLKQLMPVWLQAQYDEHAPAQTNAQNSLEKTFPDSKLPEVISFCKSEVVAHLLDNLVGTGESALIRKTDSPEQKELQLARIASSSLRAVHLVCARLPRALDAWLWEQLAALLQAKPFWKRAAHRDSKIRAAWYVAVGRIIERYKCQFAEQYGQKTLRILIAGKESNPLAAAQLWDCVVLFMYNVEEWYKYLDDTELFNKRILDVLKSGGWGDARHLANMLLPLLARLPPDMLTKEFYLTFFEAIFTGLDQKAILISKSERQSWITSLDECLRYLSTQPLAFVPEVVTGVHRTWLQRALGALGGAHDALGGAHDAPLRTHLIKFSAGSMAALLKYWLKQAKEDHSEKYDQLIRNFWQNVGSTIATQIDKLSTDHADIGRLIDGHILLLQTLKTSFAQEGKKHQSIKFDGDEPSEPNKSPNETPQCDSSIVERYNHNLNDLVEQVCGHYFEFASTKQISSPVLTPLITLLTEFDSKHLFSAVARQFGCESTYAFYDTVLRTWLAGDTMRCTAVLDIVFLFMKHLSEPEQDALFDSFKQFPPSVVEWCISLSLSHPHSASRAARRWLRGALVAATLASLCSRLIDCGDSKAKNLLLMCLSYDASGEMMVSSQAVSSVVEQLSAALCCARSPALEQLASAGALLAERGARPGLARLVLSLFQLSLLVPRGSARLPGGARRSLRAAWQDGLGALPPAAARAARAHAAAALHAHLHLDSNLPREILPGSSKTSNEEPITDTSNASLNIEQMEHAASLCPYLLSGCGQAARESEHLSRRALDLAPRDPALVEAYALRHDILRADISCPFADNDVTKSIVDADTVDEMTKENLIPYLKDCIFRGLYLRAILLHRVDEDLEDTWCNDLLQDDYFVEEFCKVIYNYIVIRSLFDAYAFWPHYDLIKQSKNRIDTLLDDIINECSLKTRTYVLQRLSKLTVTNGYYWSFARRYFLILAKLDKLQTRQESGASFNSSQSPESNEVKTTSGDSETSQNKPADNEKEANDTKSECSESEEEITLENLKEIVTGHGFFHMLQASCKWARRQQSAQRAADVRYVLMLRGLHAAHAHEPFMEESFLERFASGAQEYNADLIVDAYYANNHIMLYDTDISTAAWSHVASNAAVAEYLSALVCARGWALPARHWDFVTISLCRLLASGRRAWPAWPTTKVALLTRAALTLYRAVEHFVSTVEASSARSQPSEHVAHLPHEWNDIFAPDLNANLFSMVVDVLESSSNTVTSNHIAVLDALVRCVRRARWELLGARARRGPLALRRLAAAAAAALGAPAHHAYKWLAYELLKVLLKPLVLEDGDGGARSVERRPSERRRRGAGAARAHRAVAGRGRRAPAARGGERPRACQAVRGDVRAGPVLGRAQPGTRLVPAGRAHGAAVPPGARRPGAPLHTDIQGTKVRGAPSHDGAAAAPGGGVRVRAGGRRAAAAAAARVRAHVHGDARAGCVQGVRRNIFGRSGVPRRGAVRGGRGRGRGARLARRRAAPTRAAARQHRARIHNSKCGERTVHVSATKRIRNRRHRNHDSLVVIRGEVCADGGGAAAGAARAARRHAPARAAAVRRAGARARREHTLARRIHGVPERVPPERAQDVGGGREQQAGALRAVLHLLLPPALRDRPPAQRALLPVPEQVPHRLSAQVVRDIQQVKLPSVPLRLLEIATAGPRARPWACEHDRGPASTTVGLQARPWACEHDVGLRARPSAREHDRQPASKPPLIRVAKCWDLQGQRRNSYRRHGNKKTPAQKMLHPVYTYLYYNFIYEYVCFNNKVCFDTEYKI